MSDKRKKESANNSSTDDEGGERKKPVQSNLDENIPNEPTSNDQSKDEEILRDELETNKENKDDKTSTGTSENITALTPNKSSSVKTRSSHYYVLHRDTLSLQRTCHLPRTANVNVKARRKLIIASILCLIFMIVEIIGGFLSNSLAIAADAAHTLSDFAAFMISLFAIWLAGRSPTDRLSFGWHRAEVIGALISIMSIWSVTAILVWLAIQRCITRDFEIDAIIMLITAAFAIVTNIALGIQLASGSSQTEIKCEEGQNIQAFPQQQQHHGHSHGCSGKACNKLEEKLGKFFRKFRKRSAKRTTITGECEKQQENMNIRAAFLHVVGDGLQSVGVLISGIIIYVQPDWVLADPICTFLFALLVLYTTIRILKDILLVLMEGTPTYVDYSAVQAIFESIDGVKSVHNLRIWALSIDKVALAVHLVIERDIDATFVLETAEKLIHSRYHLYETTIQIEEDYENGIIYPQQGNS